MKLSPAILEYFGSKRSAWRGDYLTAYLEIEADMDGATVAEIHDRAVERADAAQDARSADTEGAVAPVFPDWVLSGIEQVYAMELDKYDPDCTLPDMTTTIRKNMVRQALRDQWGRPSPLKGGTPRDRAVERVEAQIKGAFLLLSQPEGVKCGTMKPRADPEWVFSGGKKGPKQRKQRTWDLAQFWDTGGAFGITKEE